MLNLEVMSGKQVGRELKVKKVEFLVGRGDGCDLKLASNEVGVHHCRIIQHDEETVLRDLDGGPGTFVNGMRVSGSLPLKEGDIVEIGPMRFKIKFDGEPLPASSLAHAKKQGSAIQAKPAGMGSSISSGPSVGAASIGARKAPAAAHAEPEPAAPEASADAALLESEISNWLSEDATGGSQPSPSANTEMGQVYAELAADKNVSDLYRELGVTPAAEGISVTKSSASAALEQMSGKKKPQAMKDKEKGNFREMAQVIQGTISHYMMTKTGVNDEDVLRALVLVQKIHMGRTPEAPSVISKPRVP